MSIRGPASALIWKTVLGTCAAGGQGGSLSIFIFHRVLPKPDPLCNWDPDADHFDRMMGWVAAWFNVLPLDLAIDRLHAGTLPARAAAITFDDGYADNLSVATPILKRHGLTATFFIATGFLDGRRMWNDGIIESIRQTRLREIDLSGDGLGSYQLDSPERKRAAMSALMDRIKYRDPGDRLAVVARLAATAEVELPDDLMLSSAQVRTLRAEGMQIGAHTINHPILALLYDQDARREIAGSKEYLEEILGEPVRLFAYPNGRPNIDYRSRDARIVQELGFDAAFTTARGVADARCDPMQLPRFTPWDRTETRFGLRIAQNYLQNRSRRTSQKAD